MSILKSHILKTEDFRIFRIILGFLSTPLILLIGASAVIAI